MLESIEFDVMNKDDKVAEVFISADRKTVKVKQYTDNIWIKPFPMEEPTLEDVADFLESRCFPRSRVNCQQLLEDLGLETYSPIGIVQKTYGRQFDDFIWLKFKGVEVKYADIKLRD